MEEREREREKMRKRMKQAVIIIHSLFPIKQAIFPFSFPLFLRELGNETMTRKFEVARRLFTMKLVLKIFSFFREGKKNFLSLRERMELKGIRSLLEYSK